MPEPTTTFHISVDGDDRWSGTLAQPNATRTDGPFASLDRARKALRAIETKSQPLRVLLRGGTYPLTDTVRFDAADSGSAQAPITFAAYPGETPVISGGQRITGWSRLTANQWQVHLPDVASGQWSFRELYIADQLAPRASLPKQGYFRVAETIEPPTSATVSDRFIFAEGDLKPWHDLQNIDLVAFIKWRAPRFHIASIDADSRTIAFTHGTRIRLGTFQPGVRYRVENVREALTEPGEWHLDFATGLLTYLAKDGENPNELTIIAPRLDTLLQLGGDIEQHAWKETNVTHHAVEPIHHLAFEGITFAHSNWRMPPEGALDPQAAIGRRAAIEADGAHHCRIECCTITCTGGYGIHFAAACKRNVIAYNEMTLLGAGGIKLGEQLLRRSEPEISAHNQIEHNHIHHAGLVHQAGIGIWIGQTFDNSVRHNHIHHLAYTAISVGWVWGYGPTNTRQIAVEYNHIHHIGDGLLNDMGGIYTLGVQPKTTIRHNRVHHIRCNNPEDGGYGGWGIYTDEGSSYILIENNLCYHTTDGGFHQHYGRENHVRNNIFALGQYTQVQCARREDHLTLTFEQNIIVAASGLFLGRHTGGRWHDDRITTKNNLYCRTDGAPVIFPGERTLAQRQADGFDLGSIIAESPFRNVAAEDFTITARDAVNAIGFQDFEVPEASNTK